MSCLRARDLNNDFDASSQRQLPFLCFQKNEFPIRAWQARRMIRTVRTPSNSHDGPAMQGLENSQCEVWMNAFLQFFHFASMPLVKNILRQKSKTPKTTNLHKDKQMNTLSHWGTDRYFIFCKLNNDENEHAIDSRVETKIFTNQRKVACVITY